MTNFDDFARMVQQMRHSQRRYEYFGNAELLERKREDEQIVDKELKRIFDTQLSFSGFEIEKNEKK